MRKVVRSTIGRNMFILMDRFKILPNDPRLATLTIAQRDFLFESIKYDNDIRIAQSEGKSIDEYYEDQSDDYANTIFNSNTRVNLVSDGDNPDELYEQVKQATNDPAYEKAIDDKIELNASEKEISDKRVDEQIKENFKEAYRKADELYNNDDEDYD